MYKRQVTGRSHDGGIDGIINEDKLGLDIIYIQAKRYNDSNSVGRKEAVSYTHLDAYKRQEYESTEKFLEERPELKKKLEKIEISLKYESYRWNLNRLTQEFKYAFLVQMHKEFKEAKAQGLFDKKYFADFAWKNMNWIVDDMDGYYLSLIHI